MVHHADDERELNTLNLFDKSPKCHSYDVEVKKKSIMVAELSHTFVWTERWNEKQPQLKNVLRQHKKVILPCLPKETIVKAAMKYALQQKQKNRIKQKTITTTKETKTRD